MGRLLGVDVETDLDLGAVGAGDVALRAGDSHRLAGGRLLPTMGEVDFDGELGTVAGELDVFHDGPLSRLRCAVVAFIESVLQ